MFKKSKYLTKGDLMDIQELNRMCFSYRFVANTVKKSTATVPNGKQVAKQLEGIANVLDNAKVDYVSRKIGELGFPLGTNVSMNLETGEVIEQIKKDA